MKKILNHMRALPLFLILISCSNISMPEIARNTSYSVRIYPAPEHGLIKLSDYYVTADDWITVYVNPDTGYTLKQDSLKSFNEDANDLTGTTLRLSGAKYQTQIRNNRRITAEFEPVPEGTYSVHIDSGLKNGVVFSNPLSGPAGTPVALILVPEPGYDLKTGTLFVNGMALSDTPPYSFIMPSENAEIQAQFEVKNFDQLKQSARNYLNARQYDTAAAFYEEAWKKNPRDPEAIFYSSIAKLAGLLIDPDVRKIISSFHMNTPGTLDDWICDGYTEGEKWRRTYAGTYTIGTNNFEGRDVRLPVLNPAHWGFVTPYSDFAVSHEPYHIQTFKNHLFWGLIASYTGGFNSLFENIQRDIFSKEFDAAAKRAASFPAAGKTELHPRLKDLFELEEYYGPGTSYVGKAELDYIFGILEVIRAAVEYFSVYNWTIELRDWLITEILPTDDFDDVLHKLFLLSDQMSGARKELWQDYLTVIRMLPFRNNFLRVRNASKMAQAKSSFIKGIGMMNVSMAYWYGTVDNGGGTTRWTSEAAGKNNWIKNGIASAKTAIDTNGVFYFPGKIPDTLVDGEWVHPSPGWDWPNASTPDSPDVRIYGLSMEKFFTPGIFSLQNIFMTEMGGEAPQLWRIEWFEDRAADYVSVYTGNKTLVTQPIVQRGRQENVAGTVNRAPFGKYTFMLNTRHLKSIFPRGFETYKSIVDGSDVITGDQELFSDIFPHIAMWPWTQSYFGNTITATQLYYWYHLR